MGRPNLENLVLSPHWTDQDLLFQLNRFGKQHFIINVSETCLFIKIQNLVTMKVVYIENAI